MNDKKRHAGKLGGLATVRKYGKAHMANIGRKGAAVFWQRYNLVPAGTSGWALLHRQSGRVVAFW